jgi:queuosine precursor transporter
MINELLFILVILLSFVLTLLAIKIGKEWVILIPPIFLVLANLFAPQLITVFGLVTSLAVPIYAAIFLATDIISEHWGKKQAQRVVWLGFTAQILVVVFSQIMIRADVLESSLFLNDSLKVIFGFLPRVVLGSLVAYVISQNWDVWLFHTLKAATNGKHLWLRNNLSTITSQLIDSVLFVFIALYGIVDSIFQFILVIWILKVLIALLDTPIMYLSYGILGKKIPKKMRKHR